MENSNETSFDMTEVAKIMTAWYDLAIKFDTDSRNLYKLMKNVVTKTDVTKLKKYEKEEIHDIIGNRFCDID